MPSPCSAADLKKCSAALRLRGTPCEPAWYLRWEGAAVSSGGGAEGGGGRGGGHGGGTGRERAGLHWPAAEEDHHDSANGKCGKQQASKENGSSGDDVRPTVGNRRLRLKSRRQGQPLGLNSPRGAVEDEVAIYAMYQAPLSLCPLYLAETPLLL